MSRSVPERTCIGCRRRAPSTDLVRITWSPSEGRLLVGSGHPGRGAWLCPNASCGDAAMRGRAFGRALRVDIPSEVIETFLAGGINGSIRPPDFHG
ncbi:MAG: YlxR family protein [Actinomycetia bacterium]|nr:YlxR family protein [Actinomycetes bacterium]